MSDKLLFLWSFLRSPAQISSIVPTSAKAAERLAKRIHKRSCVIVEYGPGTGVLAKALLGSGALSADSTIILIEKSAILAARLRDVFADPRVHVFHDSAEHVEGILASCGKRAADYIFSSIPLSIMPKTTVDHIVRSSIAALADTGSFIVFLYRPAVRAILLRHFSSVCTSIEFCNFPPLLIFEAHKKDALSKSVPNVLNGART